jgi:hypothetical protein
VARPVFGRAPQQSEACHAVDNRDGWIGSGDDTGFSRTVLIACLVRHGWKSPHSRMFQDRDDRLERLAGDGQMTTAWRFAAPRFQSEVRSKGQVFAPKFTALNGRSLGNAHVVMTEKACGIDAF